MRTIIHEIVPVVPVRKRGDDETPFGGFGAMLLRKRAWTFQAVFVAGAVALASLLRLALDNILPAGFPFLTFFPAVLVTLIFAGVQAGLVTAVICGLIAWRFFISPGQGVPLDSGALLAMAFYVAISGVQVFFVAANVAALRALDDTRRRSAQLARSRELMFAELQHRVSNNLATVAALLRMQAGRSDEPEVRKALSEATQRVQTVSRLQRSLHSPDMQDVDAREFLSDLATETLEASHLEARPHFTLAVTPLNLARDQAVPLGLIASEMLMNAVEHGVPDTGPAKVRISLVVEGEAADRQAVLEVQDNGRGLPEGFALEKAPSLGLSIARQFAQQLGGTLSMQAGPEGGTLSRLRFPV